MKLNIYGIKNCNTVKKALDWLDQNQLSYTFHDYKKEPATIEKLQQWEQKIDWQQLVNKRGTTWRKLTEDEQSRIQDADSANEALLSNNSMIKRPIIEYGEEILLGFDEKEYTEKLK